jgi:hypothetical protein
LHLILVNKEVPDEMDSKRGAGGNDSHQHER